MDATEIRKKFEGALREDCEISGMKCPDFRLSPCVLDDGAVIYVDSVTQACWWSFRKGWHASREAVVVELPYVRSYPAHEASSDIDYYMDEGRHDMRAECRKAIEAQGIKVSP